MRMSNCTLGLTVAGVRLCSCSVVSLPAAISAAVAFVVVISAVVNVNLSPMSNGKILNMMKEKKKTNR